MFTYNVFGSQTVVNQKDDKLEKANVSCIVCNMTIKTG